MRIIASPSEMQAWALQLRCDGRRIGLVPTMGFLHEGHLSLIRIARRHSDVVVVSLFVNPAQFGPTEDFNDYPRDPERDVELCGAEGVEVVFSPDASDMYCPDHSTNVEETSLSSRLCGPARPGHFRGVATVVAKLFNLIQPTVAVFGRKDYQQALVIGRMVRDLDFPVRIVTAPTVRESDGLAMSSRNRYLSPEDRSRAAEIVGALRRAEELHASGTKNAGSLRRAVTRHLGRAGLDPEYVETVDAVTLEPVETVERPTLLALAVRVGRTRLIDNTVLGSAR